MSDLEFIRIIYSIMGIGIIIFGIWLSRKIPTRPKLCKRCGSEKLEMFAGIGADGIVCKECDKIQ